MRRADRSALLALSLWPAVLGARSVVARVVAGRVVGTLAPTRLTPRILQVGDRVWRGPAPCINGYAELAGSGVSLVVDLRLEADVKQVRRLTDAAGLELLTLAIDNSTAPELSHLREFIAHHDVAPGITYVHCEAGEGRTGAIIGAHQVMNGRSAREAIADALSIGSLTFGQLAFIGTMGRFPMVVRAIEWAIDRPTEWMFDRARRNVP